MNVKGAFFFFFQRPESRDEMTSLGYPSHDTWM